MCLQSSVLYSLKDFADSVNFGNMVLAFENCCFSVESYYRIDFDSSMETDYVRIDC